MGKFADVLELNRQKQMALETKVPAPLEPPDEKMQPHKPAALKSSEPRSVAPTHPVDWRLVTLHQPRSFESEQFKHLRTGLLFPISGKRPRSIMVTSATPGEGKSFVTANLAVSIAQGIEEHVLVMDCDLRRPRMHTMFGFENVAGLRDHLIGNVHLSSLLLKTCVDKLNLLAAGDPPHNPAELLSSDKMFSLLQEVRDRYDDRFILVDSPPPQLTAESSAIARYVDGILVVVEAGKTGKDDIMKLVEAFGREKIIGGVLNRFDMRLSGYYGRYGKYDEYFHSGKDKKA